MQRINDDGSNPSAAIALSEGVKRRTPTYQWERTRKKRIERMEKHET
jgi:hypothetical protein